MAMATVLGVCALSGCGSNGAAQETTKTPETTVAATETTTETTKAAETAAVVEKKEDSAILAVSFGTSFNDSRDITIGAVETAIAEAFPEYEVRRAFTSQIIIDILKERDSLEIDNVKEALDRAVADGVKELVVQPTHLMNGFEYQDLAVELTGYVDQFNKIILSEPLIMSDADYAAVVKAITEKTAEYDDGKTAVCFMGHGTHAESNAIYAKLQDKLTEGGYENYYVGTVEAAPTLDDVMAAMKDGAYEKVVLEPLMVVAGDHANNDMAGAEEDSWKSVLEKEGYQVECILEGLGQIPAIQQIYVDHVGAAIADGTAFTGVEVAATEVGAELENGTYSVEVESSSSMFKIVDAKLNVEDGGMSAVITMSGTGYTKLFMGTGEEASKAAESEVISYVEDAEGAYTFTFPVEALDQPIDCAAFSQKKEEWYDRQLTFKAASVSGSDDAAEAAVEDDGEKKAAAATPITADNGTYTIDVTLNGGSGKTTLVSPATITVKDGVATAVIQWTSQNYDYMIVDGEKYLQTNTEGDSVFEIPVAALDAEFPVIGNTVAMSKPHEIEYTVIFHSGSMKAAE